MKARRTKCSFAITAQWRWPKTVTTARRQYCPGYTVHRFPSGVGFAMGNDPHVFKTWRMDGEHHAHATVRNFKTLGEARADLAYRLRIHRMMLRQDQPAWQSRTLHVSRPDTVPPISPEVTT